MEELLHHYERELAFLRERAKGFAERYPKIAGRLQVSSEIAEDPHVERMIESFALLTSRIHKRLDDDFPLFTETFLDVLYPHYLRPFPAASIAHFDVGSTRAQMNAPAVVPRGTLLNSRPVQGVACQFRTCSDVTLVPLDLTAASYRHAVSAPTGTPLPGNATSALSLRFELASSEFTFEALDLDRLRVYLDGEAAQVSALREVLASRTVGVMLQLAEGGEWTRPLCNADGTPALPQLAGFAEDESLLEHDERSHPAYRLLTEYFAFPEKFNFVDLPWPREALRGTARRSVTLHILFANVRSDGDQARLLEGVAPQHLVLSCAPVVNLFSRRADPIRVTQQASAYPLVVDARRAYGYEVYSIDKVFRVQQTPHGDSVVEFKPFYSLQHDELNEGSGHYWHAHRDEGLVHESPGYETELSIVDVDFDPSAPSTDTLSIEVTATNRDLPATLSIGHPSGDLSMEGGGIARVRMLRKPTASARFERGRGALWRLISHLSLNHLSLSSGGAQALREMLRLYDLTRAASNQRQVDGIVDIDYRAATAWLPGNPFATFVRGMEVRLTVDEEAFVGSGLSVFVAVMDRFFGLYVHANSFTQLTVLSARSGEELFKCPPRSGETPLV